MISRLEAQLGTRLFDRDTRHVALTPEGQVLVPLARALATDVESMYGNLRDYAERRKGKIAIAAKSLLEMIIENPPAHVLPGPASSARKLGACRTWGVESENRPQRGQFLPDLQAHSPAMGQKDG